MAGLAVAEKGPAPARIEVKFDQGALAALVRLDLFRPDLGGGGGGGLALVDSPSASAAEPVFQASTNE